MPDKRTTSVLEWPDELPGLQWLPAFWGEIETRFAPLFSEPPDLVVVHSASAANWVAEYLSNPKCPLPHTPRRRDPTKAVDGCRLVGGYWYRIAAAHLCWYAGKAHKLRNPDHAPKHANTFVQQVSLRRSCPGAGGSQCQGMGAVNARSYHIELPARPENPAQVRRLFRTMVRSLCEIMPSLAYWTTHREIDPRNKRDPVTGSGFNDGWCEGLGLEFAGRD